MPAAAPFRLMAVVALAATATGCGGGTDPLLSGTTTTVLVGSLAVEPTEGPVGTVFVLTGSGLRGGEVVAFEIAFPDEGRAYPGTALTVGEDGSVSISYRATTANPPGTYAVRLTGATGTLAESSFAITGPGSTGNGPSRSTTTAARGGTGTGRTTTTTTGRSGGATTTPTTRATTTSTTRRTTTTKRAPTSTAPTSTTPTTTRRPVTGSPG